MRGVTRDGLTFNLSDECPLVWFDDDLNDPPPELRPDVEEWLEANTPNHKLLYGDLLDVAIVFESERDAVLFKTYWL
jgi:hypothetical protein